MNFITKRVHKEISNYIKDFKDVEIDLKVNPPCEPKHNQQCMNNCMNEYKAGRSMAIMEVISSQGDCVHYLCIDKNGDIYDPTLGFEWSGSKYKLLQYIHPDKSSYMNTTLKLAKENIVKNGCGKLTKFLMRLFFISCQDVV